MFALHMFEGKKKKTLITYQFAFSDFSLNGKKSGMDIKISLCLKRNI